jgi:hypothetical protein
MPSNASIRWFQFRLRSLLLGLTLVAIGPGGYLVYQRHLALEQRSAVEALQRLRPEVYARPNWLHSLLVDGAPGDVVGLALRNPYTADADLAPIAEFSELVWLHLAGTRVSDAGLEYLTGLKSLERLRLDDTHVTDAGLVHLAALPKLRVLNLERTGVTDAGLVHLARLPLEELYLGRTNVTPAAVVRFRQSRLKPNHVAGP